MESQASPFDVKTTACQHNFIIGIVIAKTNSAQETDLLLNVSQTSV